MARIVWDRRDDISKAKDKIPFTPTASDEDFRPPSTIESDFTRLLNHNVPHINWTFEVLKDWFFVSTQTDESLAELTEARLKKMYADGTRIIRIHRILDENTDEYVNIYYLLSEDGTYAETKNYHPKYIRAQMTPIDWKSKIGNSDMSVNFKTDYGLQIRKGDMVIREDGMLYILNWNVTNHANNQATQAVECNAVIDILREFQDETDDAGYLIEAGGMKPYITQLPISHSEYAGRPDFSGSTGQPGIHPDHLISVYCQWNKTTRQIRLDDEFVLGDFTYRVINVSLAEVQIDKDYGVLTLNAKRVAGGTVYGDE